MITEKIVGPTLSPRLPGILEVGDNMEKVAVLGNLSLASVFEEALGDFQPRD